MGRAKKSAAEQRWHVREGVEPLPGVGPGPMTDEEFDEAAAGYLTQFPEMAAGTVRGSGIYEQRPHEPRAVEVPADGVSTGEVIGDGSGEALPPIDMSEE